VNRKQKVILAIFTAALVISWLIPPQNIGYEWDYRFLFDPGGTLDIDWARLVITDLIIGTLGALTIYLAK